MLQKLGTAKTCVYMGYICQWYLFCKMSHQQCVRGSLFSRALPKFVVYCLFDVSHADSRELMLHCDFDFCFPGD